MKILYFLWLFFIPFLSTELASQPYINQTSQWKQYLEYGSNNCDCITIKDRLYQISGDTLIGNNNYFKVLVNEIYTIQYQLGSTTTKNWHYYTHPIREENKVIYAYNTIKKEEYLLYDFNLVIGDPIGWTHCNTDTIASIDTIFFGNIPLQRFHIRTSSSALVEGIGSTRGLYEQPCSGIPPAIAYLQCYCQDGNCIQFVPNYNCNTFTPDTTDIQDPDTMEIQIDPISITPNPFRDKIKIQFGASMGQDLSLSIYNSTGSLILKKALDSIGQFEIIWVTDLPVGIYLICIHNAEERIIKKMVKL